jgi:hypothetical protein
MIKLISYSTHGRTQEMPAAALTIDHDGARNQRPLPVDMLEGELRRDAARGGGVVHAAAADSIIALIN